jgi:rubrerythrin
MQKRGGTMDNDTLFEIFKKAIYNEDAAHDFYTKAAAQTTNKDAKTLFEKFATMELSHRTALEDLYRTLKK